MTVDLSADYIAFEKSRVNREDVAFAGTPVATPVSLRGAVDGHAVVLGAGLGLEF